MRTTFRLGFIAFVTLAISLTSVSGTAARNGSGEDAVENEYVALHAAVTRDEQNLLRFSSLLERLDSAAKESNDAHREGVVVEIISEMDQELRHVRRKIDKKYFLPEKGVTADNDAGGSAVVCSRAQARLTAMEEICRVCTEIQEPAIDKQKRELKTFKQKSREFYQLMEDELRATRSLVPAEYLEAGSLNSK